MEAAAAQFWERGFCVCEGVFAPDEVDALGSLLSRLSEEEIAAIRAKGQFQVPQPGQLPTLDQQRIMSQVEVDSDGTTVRPRKLDRPWYKGAAFQDFATDPRLTAICRTIFGGRTPLLYSDQAFMKPPGGGRKPYHQDNWCE